MSKLTRTIKWTNATVIAATIGLGAASRAAAASPEDTAKAQQLFDQAKALMNDGDFPTACPEFAESQRLDPAPGTLLNLANCYEKNGQTATAVKTFRDAATAAHAANRTEWEKTANERRSALEPRVSHLTINLATPDSTISITRDGAPFGTNDIGARMPIDPGAHRIVASAPGKESATFTVNVGADSDDKTLTVPALGVAGRSPDSDGARETSSAPGSTQRTVGIVLGAVGIAGIAVGAVTGFLAIGKNGDATKVCPNDGACASSAARDDNSSARTFGNVSTATFIGGGALVAGGVLLYVLAPREASSSTGSRKIRFTPTVGRGDAGFLLTGSF